MYFDVVTWGYYVAVLIRLRISAVVLGAARRCNRCLRETGSQAHAIVISRRGWMEPCIHASD